MVNEAGLRERNKQQKLERIKQAAWQLFREKGYDATTTREIAEVAQVGTGTLFLYARDKQELLLLVYYETIESLIEEAFATLPEKADLLTRLMHIFSFFMNFYARDIDTAREYVRNLSFQKNLAGQRLRAVEQIQRFSARLAELIEQAKVSGEVAPDTDSGQAAINFFGLYYSNLTGWLSGMVELDTALNQGLRKAFELQIKGLQSK
ncbi:MAG TPA: TetR/AcrR family transcriptional regulator [Chloroflexia bacterium]|nr:TetR/AcrR family transcriptional regulator [Chloroflexia bacterium]